VTRRIHRRIGPNLSKGADRLSRHAMPYTSGLDGTYQGNGTVEVDLLPRSSMNDDAQHSCGSPGTVPAGAVASALLRTRSRAWGGVEVVGECLQRQTTSPRRSAPALSQAYLQRQEPTDL